MFASPKQQTLTCTVDAVSFKINIIFNIMHLIISFALHENFMAQLHAYRDRFRTINCFHSAYLIRIDTYVY